MRILNKSVSVRDTVRLLARRLRTACRDAVNVAKRAISPTPPRRDARLCLVVHDALRHGAQYLALNLARVWAEELNITLDIVLLADGPLRPRFERYGRVHDLTGCDPCGARARALASALARGGVNEAVCNSAATGLFVKTLADAGLRCVTLIHELPGTIAHLELEHHVRAIKERATLTVFPAASVRDAFVCEDAPCDTTIRAQGLYKRSGNSTKVEQEEKRKRWRTKLGLQPTTRVVLNVGYGDARKGVDLFVELAQILEQKMPDVAFVWVGALDPSLGAQVQTEITAKGLDKKILFVGFQEITDDCYAGADVFALTSREDPFPTVVLEALDAGLPFVAFEGAGGFSELATRGCGVLAPSFDVPAYADLVAVILSDPQRRAEMGGIGRAIVAQDYSFRRYAFDIAALACARRPRVSVVVPNFNYAKYLPDRLASIIAQTYPIYELIILDDASTDDSVSVVHGFLSSGALQFRLFVNDQNSGSPFHQWRAGALHSEGDIVWIAEADDLSEPGFVKTAIAAFTDTEIVMSYTQSSAIDASGRPCGVDYLAYVADLDDVRWRQSYRQAGSNEIREYLAVRNTVPNVSACLFRRSALVAALTDHGGEISSYRVAGDWATYVRVLERGAISYSPRALNKHRRHAKGLTIASAKGALLAEIVSMQAAIQNRHDVTPETAKRAHAYAQKLYEEFGFSTEANPNVEDDIRFRAGVYAQSPSMATGLPTASPAASRT